jgi:hypothetical protein
MSGAIFAGTGDTLINLDRAREPALVHLVGNAERKHFIVSACGPDGRRIHLLAATISSYEGTHPLDFSPWDHTTRFRVKAAGSWHIEVWLLTADVIRPRTLIVPGRYEGAGDDVLFLAGATPGSLAVDYHTEKHLGIRAWGTWMKLLVNTVGSYQGTVELAPDTKTLQVKAGGPWELSISAAAEKA